MVETADHCDVSSDQAITSGFVEVAGEPDINPHEDSRHESSR